MLIFTLVDSSDLCLVSHSHYPTSLDKGKVPLKPKPPPPNTAPSIDLKLPDRPQASTSVHLSLVGHYLDKSLSSSNADTSWLAILNDLESAGIDPNVTRRTLYEMCRDRLRLLLLLRQDRRHKSSVQRCTSACIF
jgi:hypothetical protein